MKVSIRTLILESRLARFLPRVLPYLKPYWGLALVTALVHALMTLIGLLEPWPLKILIDSALQNHPLPATVTQFVGGISSNRIGILLFAVGAQFGLTVLSNAASVLSGYAHTKLEQNASLDFRSDRRSPITISGVRAC